MSDATPIRERIIRKLSAAFTPSVLDVEDQSARHSRHVSRVEHGRGPDHDTGETHFKVIIVSECFEGMTRLDRHRNITDVLAAEIAERVHALSIVAQTNAEREQQALP